MSSSYAVAPHAEIQALFVELAQAWGRGDADAYGAAFTEDATYTAWFGTLYQGRADIVESHRALFGSFLKGTEMAVDIVGIRCYGADFAIVNSRGDLYKGGAKAPRRLGKAQTYTLVRQDNRWRVAAFHNTKRKKLMERFTFRYSPAARPAARR
ncbi:SgcJ/EcaC family oxidoreductase [Nocardia brasiliensis]|uniref:SgcJ/EcaC family oxidoreductase n=1 Tax=Nocardia brasiliensis TaxID=37326 RepID=A0A6G9XJU6_NOCBR|nr:SgcJ/EcaC family oxidoreductase [Nocardia brasiliensis]QIS01192.1 SgcJ/EcaC family oxidoreductase [Nocardia brasiliensis]